MSIKAQIPAGQQHRKPAWVSRDGKRRVESISLDGRPTFKVTDPRWTLQSREVLAFVPVLVLDGRLAPVTIAALRQRGVDLAELRQEGGR